MIRSSYREYSASTASQHFSEGLIFVRSVAAPLGIIIGPAIGGFFVFLTVIIILTVIFLTRKHREKLRDLEGGPARNELKSTIRSTCPPENLSRKLSRNPFHHTERSNISDYWGDEDDSDGFQMGNLKTKRFSSEKGFFRVSGFRESWPLVSSMQVPTISISTSSSSKISLSPVAPPGYVVNTDLTWPKRTLSRSSRRSRSTNLITQPQPFATEADGNFTVVKLTTNRHRSSSVHQLSSILRSTSDRLKPTQGQRHSLKRTYTTAPRLPGSPPKGRLPSPPVNKATESREVLIDHDHSESGNSSIFERYVTKTPSPPKLIPRSAGNAKLKKGNPINSSTDSDSDSLCGVDTPDLVIPAQLTSPSKRGVRTEKRHQMHILSGGSKSTLAMIQKDNRTSVFVPGNGLTVEKRGLSNPHRISLASDPFYSSVKSSKPVIPTTQIFGPRPLYIRKATFGQEATTERPLSFTSPLRDINGNVQAPTTKESRSPTPSEFIEPNPFQWSPQEAITRASLTSPKRAGPQERKGHKRSRVIRLSGLHRPPSVCVVPEEPEEDSSPLRLHSRANSDFQIFEPMKTSSPRASMPVRRLSDRPPSTASFNPCLSIPELLSTSRCNSLTLEMDAASSPTLSICNYYAEHNSEEDCFSAKDSASIVKSRRHDRNFSKQFGLETKALTSFPEPSTYTTPELPASPSPAPRPTATTTISRTTSPFLLNAPLPLPAPPLLTIPVPAHLTGPRNPPRPRMPRDSLTTSIGLLRRMNSEISVYSIVSSLNGDSPTIPDLQRITAIPSMNSIIGSRGSRNYLSIGSTAPRMSHLSTTRTIHELEALPAKENVPKEFPGMSSSPSLYSEPFSSPATGPNALGIQNLRFPTLTSTGASAPPLALPPLATPPSAPKSSSAVPQASLKLTPISTPATEAKESRWSSAMIKPSVRSVRRESKMEHPSPKTPPKWAQVDFLDEGQENERKGEDSRPSSAGWYDQEGFLKSSPRREVGF